jgi:NitT/TauT family transport system substrate-binding protein
MSDKTVTGVWIRFPALAVIAAILLAGCITLPPATVTPAQGHATPADQTPASARPSGARLVIYAPATPSSIPVLLAARQMGDAEVTIFANQAQANALFVRGDVDILVTGLSVGVDLFKNGAPVQVANSYVAGLTYLVTYGKPVGSFTELKGKEVYIPFEGSPIDEITQFFVASEGLTWKTDIQPVYLPFASSVELLKQGKATAVALPEPYVSLIEGQPNLFISLDYRARWDALTGAQNGYPQVGSLIRRDWAAAHGDVIARFNAAMAAALSTIAQDPAAAVAQTQAQMGLPTEVLRASLARTDFAFTQADEMAQDIQGYYRTIGRPLDETYGPFFYRGAQ